MGRVNLEFGLIFKKRLFELRYNYGPYVSNGLASIIFTILTGVISILIYNSWNAKELYHYQQSDYHIGSGTKFAIALGSTTVDPTMQIVQSIESQTGLEAVTFEDKDALELGCYNSTGHEYAFAVYVDTAVTSPRVFCNATLYYNLTGFGRDGGFENEKAKLNALIMRAVYSAIGQDYDLALTYEPLNSGFELARLWGFFGPLLISFAILNIGSALGTQLVEDRENYRLHSLITSGLHQPVYWLANWVFDLIIYLIYVIIDWLILLAFGTDAIIKNNWSATFFLFVFSAVQTLPLVYMISMLFDKLQSINAFLQNILIVITLIPYFIVTLVLENSLDDAASLIISIIPSYAVQNGLDVAAKRAVGDPLDAKDTWTGKMVQIFAVQLGSAILYGIIAFLISHFKNRAKGRNIKDVDGDKGATDEDVAEMERQIAEGMHDDEAIVVKNLDKVYVDSNGHAFKAVNNVSVYVKKGEMFGVLGANGAGKSTLMSVITGRTNATAGKITILGHNIGTGADAKEFVSICPQFDTHLFPSLTPRQHFEMYGRLKGYAPDELERQIAEYEEIMNLGKYSNRLVRQLSGGNARKLSIALAFLGNAPIVFLDEPTASLDPVARLQTQELIKEKANGRTILLCTHLLSEAEKLCDRLCIMLTGKIHAVGTHQHLSDKFGTKWKVELGLISDSEECRAAADAFMNKNFPGCELAGTRFAAATYNVPKGNLQLPEVFVILTENRNQENGYTYFTCSTSTLERVFIDLVIQSES